MPTSPNWYRVQRKPVRTPIIRLHGAPTLIPSKRNQTVTSDKYLLIPETKADSPPPSRRRSFSLPSANRSRIGSAFRSLSQYDLRNVRPRRSGKNIAHTSQTTANAACRSRFRETTRQVEEGLKRRNDYKYLDYKLKHIELIEARRSVSDQDIPTAVQANSVEESDTEEESEFQQSFVCSCDTDSVSVSSDEYALEVYPPSLSQDSIEISPILISHPFQWDK